MKVTIITEISIEVSNKKVGSEMRPGRGRGGAEAGQRHGYIV
jgi:hypothetical protein